MRFPRSAGRFKTSSLGNHGHALSALQERNRSGKSCGGCEAPQHPPHTKFNAAVWGLFAPHVSSRLIQLLSGIGRFAHAASLKGGYLSVTNNIE